MKKFFLIALSLGLLATTALSAKAKSYNTVTNLSQMQVQGQIALEIFKNIETMTAGRVKLSWHDAGDLIPVDMHINAVSSGAVPVAFTALAYFGGVVPIANIYSGFPFSPDVDDWVQWLFQGDGLEILQEVLDPMNIVAIPMMATPREGGGFFKRAINTPEDLKGLRFRIGGWGGEVVSRLGVAVSQIPATELFLAMDRGRIDALEFSTPSLDESWGFHKLASHYYFPGWHQPVGWQWLLINKKVWDSWSKPDQEAVLSVCRGSIMTTYNTLASLDVAALQRIIDDPKVAVGRFPAPVLQALRTSWDSVLAEGMVKHPEVKKAYESFMSFTAEKKTLRDLQDLSDYQ